MNKTVKLLLVIVSGILVGIMIYSAYNIIEDKVVHSEARSKDNQVVESYVIQNPVSPTPRVYEEQVTNQILLDDEVSPLNSMVDLSKFFVDYKDAVAWIYSPDTKINYGVVEAEDNDFYLHRAMDGSYSISGSLFVDCNNKRDFSDENTVIYGHHMNDGTKFASIMGYRENGYYAQHPVLYLSTPDMNYRVEVFSAYLTDADSDTYTFRFSSTQEYAAWLQRMRSQSDFQTDVMLSTSDRVITLSTCSYEYTDARYVVQGKLVPIH